MSALENMKSRINYNGGKDQEFRMNTDKLRSLKKALLYSYQAATAILSDGREFRCLINPDKLKTSYDEKIISIPFYDVELNTALNDKTKNGEVEIGLKAGDVFTWKENNTDWLVYLRRYEETAYFRAEIRKCDYEIDIDGKTYKVYASGPSEASIVWNKVKDVEWNDINYSLSMYITKDEKTEQFFHRFSKIKLDGKPWEVQAVDDMSAEGLIIVALKEDYQNTIEEQVERETWENEPDPYVNPNDEYIDGPSIVYPYDTAVYTIKNTSGGSWEVSDSDKVVIGSQTETELSVGIYTGKKGSFTIIYKRDNKDDIVLNVTIESL